MSQEIKFTLLIGSFARGTHGADSDVDILRIGHFDKVKLGFSVSNSNPISYIDFDIHDFTDIFEDGSLFLYHAFNEGVLIDGDPESWYLLKEKFEVSSSFKKYIDEYAELLNFIKDYKGYESSPLPYLSNIFMCAKNIGIFKLAEKKEYNFEKYMALTAGCGLSDEDARLLLKANTIYERTGKVKPDLMSALERAAIEWKNNFEFKMDLLRNDK